LGIPVSIALALARDFATLLEGTEFIIQLPK